MKLVVIEGNIGCGKTTLMNHLGNCLEAMSKEKWTKLIEPVDEDPEFHRLLKQFIANPTDANKRAEFQLYMTNQRANMLGGLPDGNYLLERSLFSDIVFTHTNMLSTQQPTGEYWNAYWDVAKRLDDYPKPDLLIYLNRDPVACYESAMHRDREGENGYDVEYFKDLHRFHLACLPQITRKYNVPYLEEDLGDEYPDPTDIAADIINTIYSS